MTFGKPQLKTRMEYHKTLWYRGSRVYKLQSAPPFVKVVLTVKGKKFGAIDTIGSSRYFKAKLVLILWSIINSVLLSRRPVVMELIWQLPIQWLFTTSTSTHTTTNKPRIGAIGSANPGKFLWQGVTSSSTHPVYFTCGNISIVFCAQTGDGVSSHRQRDDRREYDSRRREEASVGGGSCWGGKHLCVTRWRR